jgi:hypothetical protein
MVGGNRMSGLPPRGAHWNALWRQQAALTREALRQARQDQEVAMHWGYFIVCMDICLTIGPTSPHIDDFVSLMWRCLDVLMACLKERAPKVEHALGPLLPPFLLRWAYSELTTVSPAGTTCKIWRFLPDNPLEYEPNGTMRHADKARPEHFRQIADWMESLQPRGRPGRSRGSGHFRNGEDFRGAMSTLIRNWYATTGTRPTRENLAEVSGCISSVPAVDARMIRRYCKNFAVDLDALIDEIVNP